MANLRLAIVAMLVTCACIVIFAPWRSDTGSPQLEHASPETSPERVLVPSPTDESLDSVAHPRDVTPSVVSPPVDHDVSLPPAVSPIPVGRSRAFSSEDSKIIVERSFSISGIGATVDTEHMPDHVLQELCRVTNEFHERIEPLLKAEASALTDSVTEKLSTDAYERIDLSPELSRAERTNRISELSRARSAQEYVHVSDYGDHIRIVRIAPGSDASLDAIRAGVKTAFRDFSDRVLFRFSGFVTPR